MATQFHRDRIIISRPQQTDDRKAWFAYASVHWREGGGFRHHQFTDPSKIFELEDEALAFGFLIARAWVDEALDSAMIHNDA